MDVNFEDFQNSAGITPTFDTNDTGLDFTPSSGFNPGLYSNPHSTFGTNNPTDDWSLLESGFSGTTGLSTGTTSLSPGTPSLSTGTTSLSPGTTILSTNPGLANLDWITGTEPGDNLEGGGGDDPITNPFNTLNQPPTTIPRYEIPGFDFEGINVVGTPPENIDDRIDRYINSQGNTNNEVENTNSPGLFDELRNTLSEGISSFRDFVTSRLSNVFSFDFQPTETTPDLSNNSNPDPTDVVSYTPSPINELDNHLAMPKEIGSQNC
jgi:hypothetical protein